MKYDNVKDLKDYMEDLELLGKGALADGAPKDTVNELRAEWLECKKELDDMILKEKSKLYKVTIKISRDKKYTVKATMDQLVFAKAKAKQEQVRICRDEYNREYDREVVKAYGYIDSKMFLETILRLTKGDDKKESTVSVTERNKKRTYAIQQWYRETLLDFEQAFPGKATFFNYLFKMMYTENKKKETVVQDIYEAFATVYYDLDVHTQEDCTPLNYSIDNNLHADVISKIKDEYYESTLLDELEDEYSFSF